MSLPSMRYTANEGEGSFVSNAFASVVFGANASTPATSASATAASSPPPRVRVRETTVAVASRPLSNARESPNSAATGTRAMSAASASIVSATGTRHVRTNEAVGRVFVEGRRLTRADARHETFRGIAPDPSRAAPQVPPEDARARVNGPPGVTGASRSLESLEKSHSPLVLSSETLRGAENAIPRSITSRRVLSISVPSIDTFLSSRRRFRDRAKD